MRHTNVVCLVSNSRPSTSYDKLENVWCESHPTLYKENMLKSTATLKERLSGDWKDWDFVSYEIGACLGFWKDFGAPPGEDHWNGAKGVIWSANPLGDAIYTFIESLIAAGMLEKQEDKFRWNPSYEIIK